MELKININNDLGEQFANQLGADLVDGGFWLLNELGEGRLTKRVFPGGLEMYQFQFNLLVPVPLHSVNPPDSDFLLINVNLSDTPIEKKVNDEIIDIQKFLPSGMLFYSPRTEVRSVTETGKDFEIALIRFPKTFFNQYFENTPKLLNNPENALIYEDCDLKSRQNLQDALSNPNQLKAHSASLNFISIFLEKLQKREAENSFENLHTEDVEGLFIAAAMLRNPLSVQKPSVNDLAKVAGMSLTKFKTTFKQMFGLPPIKYRQKIKMEYARGELESGRKTAGNVSYELGYSHPSKFTVAFKKQFGLLPSDISA